jgi:hypothetical protein
VIFTHHAYERYRQFHMLDQPTVTNEDARVILEAHGSGAIRRPARTPTTTTRRCISGGARRRGSPWRSSNGP